MPEIFSNTTLTVNQLIEKIDTGELGLPELQRPFIWKDTKVRDLFDSMMRGYQNKVPGTLFEQHPDQRIGSALF